MALAATTASFPILPLRGARAVLCALVAPPVADVGRKVLGVHLGTAAAACAAVAIIAAIAVVPVVGPLCRHGEAAGRAFLKRLKAQHRRPPPTKLEGAQPRPRDDDQEARIVAGSCTWRLNKEDPDKADDLARRACAAHAVVAAHKSKSW